MVPFFCASALAAADFESLLVRPSLRIFDAAEASDSDIVFFGALICDNALPAAVFVLVPDSGFFNAFDALDAAFPP